MEPTLRIDRRFCGPPESGNGGYVCGRLARFVDGEATVVRLHVPPPLEVELGARPAGREGLGEAAVGALERAVAIVVRGRRVEEDLARVVPKVGVVAPIQVVVQHQDVQLSPDPVVVRYVVQVPDRDSLDLLVPRLAERLIDQGKRAAVP
jgi:hypothetical protein